MYELLTAPCTVLSPDLMRQETIKVVKILSGDPSRGALALETEDPLLPGQMIQVTSLYSSPRRAH